VRAEVRTAFNRAYRLFRPAPRISPCDWAERNLRLSRATTSKPGRFKAYPWQRPIINAIEDPALCSAVVIFPAQLLGKSLCLSAVIGWSIDASPAPQLLVMPSVDSAETFSKNKLGPLFLDSPVLRELVTEEELKFRQKGFGASTVSLKRYPAGFLMLVGANASSGLRSSSVPRLYFDECSAFPETVAGDEGDPIWIATKRSESHPNSFSYLTSTPSILGSCRITSEWEDTNQMWWHLRCESCQHEFSPRWSHVEWKKDIDSRTGKTLRHHLETAALKCPACGTIHSDEARQRMSLAGRFIATNPAVTNRAGFRATGLIAVAKPKRGYVTLLHQFADEYLRAVRKGTYFVRAFQNGVLAEAYEVKPETPIETNVLCDRRETYPETDAGEIIVPMKVAVLTVGADIQRDRIEAEILGTGPDGETFGIEYKVFKGNTELRDVYQKLDAWAQRKWRHESGWLIWPEVICIDSAFKSEAVYRYTRSCVGRRVHACIGHRGWAPLGSNWINRSNNEDMKDHLWIMKKDGAIESIFSRLQLEEKGPGYQHYPNNINAGYDATYFKQLTSQVLKVTPSGQRYYTVPDTTTRDEALAVRVLAEAAVATLPPIDFEEIARRFAGPPPAGMAWHDSTPAPTPEAEEEESDVVREFREMIGAPVKKNWIRDIK
jgi:phage terminase large subunit GpA-like protein